MPNLASLPSRAVLVAALVLALPRCTPVPAADTPRLATARAGVSAPPFTLVADLVDGAEGSTPHAFLAHGAELYFVAIDGKTGEQEVWRTDGTPTATVPVTRTPYGPGLQRPRELALDAQGRVFFVSAGSSLVVSSGTPDSTHEVPGAWVSESSGLAPLPSGVAFAARISDSVPYCALHVATSDGASQGELLTGAGERVLLSGRLVRLGEVALFAGWVGTAPPQLWVTDGTSAGTRPLTAFAESAGPPLALTVLGSRVLFFTRAGDTLTLHASDGRTSAPVVTLPAMSDLDPTTPVREWVPFSGGLAFALGGTRLWFTDGTAAGTLQLTDLAPQGVASALPLGAAGGVLLIAAREVFGDVALWRWEGTQAASRRVKMLQPGWYDPSFGAAVALHGSLYFLATTGGFGTELWRSDGTPDGTVVVQDFALGEADGTGEELAVAGTRLFVGARGPEGLELRSADEAMLAALVDPRVTCADVGPVESTSPNGTAVEVPVPQGVGTVSTGTHVTGPAVFRLGTWPVQGWGESDAGLVATCRTNVRVVDTVPPTLQCPERITFDANGAGAVDIWSWQLSAYVHPEDSGSEVILRNSLGDSVYLQVGQAVPVDIEATDGAGNRAVCHSVLEVTDSQDVRLNCPATLTLVATSSDGVDASTLLGYLYSSEVVRMEFTPGGRLPVGVTQVAVRGYDARGSMAECTVQVTVTYAPPERPGPLVGKPGPPDPRELPASALPGCTAAAGGLARLLAALWLGPALLRRRRRAAGAARA